MNELGPSSDSLADLVAILPLFRELNHLKRIRVAGRTGSLAEQLFVRAWSRLVSGCSAEDVAMEETANAVAATLLAGVDAQVLAAGGVPVAEHKQILRRAFDAAGGHLDPNLANRLKASLAGDFTDEVELASLPQFVRRLAAQPRAGATRPGHPRVVLEPAENHAEHCAIVAVNGVLAAGALGAEPVRPFLTGLAHHLHNAYLPDAGDAGDAILGEHLQPIMETFRALTLTELPSELHEPIRQSLSAVYRADFPEARAFQAADSLDRVLEMEWHARSAAFTLDVALGDMDIIHPGPVQGFQMEVMRAAGWK